MRGGINDSIQQSHIGSQRVFGLAHRDRYPNDPARQQPPIKHRSDVMTETNFALTVYEDKL